MELTARDAGLTSALDAAKAKVLAFAGSIGKIGLGMAAAGAGILTPIAVALSGAVSRGQQFDMLSRQVGGTTEELSAFGFALETLGLDTDDLSTMLKKLNKEISQARDGNEEAIKTFGRLGLNFEALNKMTPVERFKAIGAAIGNLADQTDRGAQAQALFGKAGEKSLRLFADGGKELDRLMGMAGDVGAVVSAEDAASAHKITVAWAEATAALKYTFQSIGASLLPNAALIKGLADSFVSGAKAVREFIMENRGLVIGTIAAAAALVTAGTALVTFGVTASVVAFGVSSALGVVTGAAGLAVSAFTAAAGVVGALLTPTAALLAVLVPLAVPFALLPVAVAASATAFGALLLTVPDVQDGLSQIWETVKTLAPKLLELGKTALWVALQFNPMYQILSRFSSGGDWFDWLKKSTIGDVFGFLAEKLGQVPGLFQSAFGQLGELFGNVKTTALDAWGAIGTALKRGDLAGAGAVALAGLNLAFRDGINTLQGIFLDFWGFLGDGWDEAVLAFNLAWNESALAAKTAFSVVASDILTRLTAATEYAEKAVALSLRAKDLATGDLFALAKGRTVDTTMSDELKKLKDSIRPDADMAGHKDDADAAAREREAKNKEDRLLSGLEKRADASDALEAAKDAFAAAMKGEADKAEAAAAAAGGPKLPGPAIPNVSNMLAQATKGVFQATDFSAVLGIGDAIAERQLEKLDSIDGKLGELVDKVEGGFNFAE